ncbi:CatA-like O-acetyltransferase [Cohnella caldifontis]|uniref:CatA-like O-acetyltransferase n=1 Tax=Cohnella caldifontis TaxID=3027471 RepID=UPI003BB4E9D2
MIFNRIDRDQWARNPYFEHYLNRVRCSKEWRMIARTGWSEIDRTSTKFKYGARPEGCRCSVFFFIPVSIRGFLSFID